MNILGISAFVHDSAACLIKNGVLVANVEEERFNRTKHTSVFPINSVKYVLDSGSINLSEIDVMVLSSFLCKIFIGQFMKEWQILAHFSDRV